MSPRSLVVVGFKPGTVIRLALTMATKTLLVSTEKQSHPHILQGSFMKITLIGLRLMYCALLKEMTASSKGLTFIKQTIDQYGHTYRV